MDKIRLSGTLSRGMPLSGNISASPPLSGELQKSTTVVEKDYEKLRNKPSINGVELIANKSFEELGDHVLTNFEILELMKKAGF